MFSLRKIWKVALVGAMLGLGQAALAADGWVDGASLELATGTRSQILRAGVQHRFESSWFESNGTHLGAYLDLTVAGWRNNYYQTVPGQTQHLWDVGVTPVWRFENMRHKGWYGEGAIGAHLLSHLYNNDRKHLSTAFEFGDHIGVGYVFDNGVDAALKIQHYSNGGIKHPNSGVNTVVAKLGFHF